MSNQILLFAKKLTIFFGLFVVIFLVLFLLSVVIGKDKNNYMYALIDKHKLMSNKTERRLIFLGGSNLAFGLNSEEIEKKYNIKVINAGLHAGLGLKFILRDSGRYIREGDIIIIVPEYEHFFGGLLDGEKTLVYTISYVYPEGIKSIDCLQTINLFKYVPETIKYNIIWGIIRTNVNEVYQRSNFNKNGDMIGHLMEKSNKEIKPYKLGKINEEAVIFLNDFVANINKLNARCYFVYPVISESYYKKNNVEILYLDQELKSKVNVEILCSPVDFMFKDNLFYDTVYHLNKQGRDQRTNKMIEILKPVIKK